MSRAYRAGRAASAALMTLVAGIVVLACGGDGSNGTGPEPTPVAAVQVSPDARTIVVGTTATLGATPVDVAGKPLTGRAVAWVSENTAIATVTQSGVVSAVGVGSTTVHATSEGKRGGATITVTATPPTPVARVDLDVDAATIEERFTRQLAATPRDADGHELTGRGVVWASSNEAVATVSPDGLVTAAAAGTATITATSEEKEGRATITVVRALVASLELDLETLALEEGASRQLVATAKDAAGRPLAGRTVQWTSSDAGIAFVAPDGRVTARRPGSVTITAATEGKSDAAAVTVSLDIAYDLLFDAETADGNTAPELYRLDIRVPAGEASRVLNARGRASDMTTSPDGSRIAFVAWADGQSNLYVVNHDGSGLRQLTYTPESESQPAWSPDGTKIAYRRWSPGGPPGVFNPSDIWVMNADGTGAVNLTADAAPGTSRHAPAWSPALLGQGYRIAYVQETRGDDGYMRAQIRSMRADGSGKVVVTVNSGDSYDDEPAWSPDGSVIVFTRSGPAQDHQLLVVNVATGSERSLIALDPAGRQYAPSWSPDGRLVAFVSAHEDDADGTYEYQVYTVRADGSGLARRTFDNSEKQNPAWIRR